MNEKRLYDKLLEHIGGLSGVTRRASGSAGIVCTCCLGSEDLAVKVIDLRELWDDEVELLRICRELSALRFFTHIGGEVIVQYKASFLHTEEKLLYLFMEQMEASFDDIFDQHRFTEDDARFAFYQVALAIALMHKHNWVHRDVKPANFLVAGVSKKNKSFMCGCSFRCADLGLARRLPPAGVRLECRQSSSTPQFTRMASTIGNTASYRPLEILLHENDAVTYSSVLQLPPIDIWGLGVFLAEMLLNEAVFPITGECGIVESEMRAIVQRVPHSEANLTELLAIYAKKRSSSARILLGKKAECTDDLFIKLRSLQISEDCIDLLQTMLSLNPVHRPTSDEIIRHKWLSSVRDTKRELELLDRPVPYQSDSEEILDLPLKRQRAKLATLVDRTFRGKLPLAQVQFTFKRAKTRLLHMDASPISLSEEFLPSICTAENTAGVQSPVPGTGQGQPSTGTYCIGDAVVVRVAGEDSVWYGHIRAVENTAKELHVCWLEGFNPRTGLFVGCSEGHEMLGYCYFSEVLETGTDAKVGLKISRKGCYYLYPEARKRHRAQAGLV
eukprot:TRINITY_DN7734_c0_g1_i3.p1 TRINITY_DN7734_c0_g1~~TRINITY_DN7734_c0_g1_i3.p1  ORF type:complete len:558 (+),score=73.44 TRINITY_DN7734_c0_g1_i3:447-2120(+)